MVCAFKMGLKQYDSKKVFGETLHRVDFRDELERFLSLSYKERENLVGVFRADVVPFGIVLFLLFMEFNAEVYQKLQRRIYRIKQKARQCGQGEKYHDLHTRTL